MFTNLPPTSGSSLLLLDTCSAHHISSLGGASLVFSSKHCHFINVQSLGEGFGHPTAQERSRERSRSMDNQRSQSMPSRIVCCIGSNSVDQTALDALIRFVEEEEDQKMELIVVEPRRHYNHSMSYKRVVFVEDPRISLEAALPRLVLITCGKAAGCPAPSRTYLGMSIAGDWDEKLPEEYRERLKAVARAIGDAVRALGMRIDPGSALAVGDAARVVVNTVVGLEHDAEQQTRTKDVLLVVDRTMDWATPLTEGDAAPPAQALNTATLRAMGWSCCESSLLERAATSTLDSEGGRRDAQVEEWVSHHRTTPPRENVGVFERLHDQMLDSGTLESGIDAAIIQVGEALENKTITPDEATKLALRIAAKRGAGCSDSAVELGFVSRFDPSRRAVLLSALHDAANARFEMISTNATTTSQPSAANKMRHSIKATFIGDTLRTVLKDRHDVAWITQSSSSTMAQVARVATGFLSSFLASSSSSEVVTTNDACTLLRGAERLFIFFLGGVSFFDYADIINATKLVQDVQVVVGGTHLLTPQDALRDATSAYVALVRGDNNSLLASPKRKKNIADLFQ